MVLFCFKSLVLTCASTILVHAYHPKSAETLPAYCYYLLTVHSPLSPTPPQIEFDDNAARSYESGERDMVIGSLLDAVHRSGNRRVEVSARGSSDGLRLTPRFYTEEVRPLFCFFCLRLHVCERSATKNTSRKVCSFIWVLQLSPNAHALIIKL